MYLYTFRHGLGKIDHHCDPIDTFLKYLQECVEPRSLEGNGSRRYRNKRPDWRLYVVYTTRVLATENGL